MLPSQLARGVLGWALHDGVHALAMFWLHGKGAGYVLWLRLVDLAM